MPTDQRTTQNFVFMGNADHVSATQVEAAFNSAYDNSPEFATKVAEIIQAGGKVLIAVTDSGGLAGANTENQETSGLDIDSIIRIPQDAFNGDYFETSTNDVVPFSLERLLAHEMFHAHWDVTDGVNRDNDWSSPRKLSHFE